MVDRGVGPQGAKDTGADVPARPDDGDAQTGTSRRRIVVLRPGVLCHVVSSPDADDPVVRRFGRSPGSFHATGVARESR
ncbi:hypothetical protein SERN_2260 [Serinibacter arcticus]|uniref:Uncharacterized protein n=1 Tax=Serinibacter arcticus TaxID=1655435 RepID=A0A4Z1E4J8_9MICO|nr:hypothetical protein SERN_2260 [Serinibacter arcticus]